MQDRRAAGDDRGDQGGRGADRTGRTRPDRRNASPAGQPDSSGEDAGDSREIFARMLEQWESGREAETPEIGRQVRGRIILIGDETSFVDFGGRSEGAIETHHFRDEAGNLTVQVGDEVSLYVVDNRDQVILAPSVRADPAVALTQILDARRAGMPVSGKVSALNAGGLEVEVAGIRAFCPVSQIEAGFCEEPAGYVGRTLEFLVTEAAEGGRRIVLSRKALLRRIEEERVQQLLGSLKEGAEVEGTVSRLESFGAFVDLGGVDGLVHVSEIRHERTEKPEEVLTVGQKVRVKVLDVRQEKGRSRISLSIRAAAPDPWDEVEEMYWVGRRVRGTIVRLADFGAFVNLSPGIDGLVHVSEAALRPIGHVREVFKAGEAVEAIVLSIDREKRRISLSVKDALAADSGEPTAKSAEPKTPAAGDLADGWVAGIQPYGLFLDLPAYGHRARGLLPHAETGEKPETDLSRRFKIGDQLRVEITGVDEEGKIRLSLIRARDRAEKERFEEFRKAVGGGSKAPDSAMAEALRRALEDRGKKGRAERGRAVQARRHPLGRRPISQPFSLIRESTTRRNAASGRLSP